MYNGVAGTILTRTEEHKLPQFIQYETDRFNSILTIEEVELIILKLL